MGHKMALILSMIFIFMVFALGSDIVVVQYIYTELDSISMNAGYIISKTSNLNKAKEYVEEHGAIFTCEYTGGLELGTAFDFYISRDYTPLIMDNEQMHLVIKRSAVIGYYI